MKLVICGSVTSAQKMVDTYQKLVELGHRPEMGREIFEIAENKIRRKATPAEKKRHIKHWHQLIVNSDGIVVCNYDKNGIQNYIGGNVLIEIGFAFVTGKKVYLMNDIPGVPYREEIELMTTKVLSGNLEEIK